MLTIYEVETILKHHGIESIEDKSTGSSLEDDLGLKPCYDIDEVYDWLGY